MLWTSLAVQWLRLCTSNAGDTFQSLVREFRSHQLHGVSKRKRIMLFKKVSSSSKYNWFWGILVFFPTHWIRIRDRKQSPVHFTCLSIRKNIIYKFNILLWTASLCKVLEYSIFDIHTLAHTHTQSDTVGFAKIFSTQENSNIQLMPQIHIYSMYPTHTKPLYFYTDYSAHSQDSVCNQFHPILKAAQFFFLGGSCSA